MIKPEATLIISVYNDTRFLKIVLDSVKKQTFRNFEIIISEDGEHEHVKSFVESYPFEQPFQHLSQPDEGWRKNRALNRAILAAKTNYLIFIDGDCILHQRFIEEHIRKSGKKRILGGKRLKMSKEMTNIFLNENPDLSKIERYLIKNVFLQKGKGIRFFEEGFYMNSHGLLCFVSWIRHMHQLKGCNMSFSKEAILSLNGFDEDYTNPAIGEDIDLTWRFKKAGYHLHSLRNLAVEYHLYHKESWTDQEENIRIMKEKQKIGASYCKNGIIKL